MKRSATWMIVVLCFGAASASAQEGYSFTASLAGGVAGVFDDQAASDFGHGAVQAGFGIFTDQRTLTTIRVGRIGLGNALEEAGLVDATIEYANVAGELRFRQAAYDFGFFLGLGAYRLSADRAGSGVDENALGLAAGFTGDFDLTRRLSLVAEANLHYAFFDDARIYGALFAGVAVHF